MPNAWITLATNDGYAVGALTLAHSLRQSGTVHEIHILYTEGVSTPLRNQLNAVFTSTTLVNILDSNDQENLTLIGRPDLGLTFTKLHAWRLTQYEKCVFLDADTLVLKNADELFDRPDFSAAPDIGWPDFFNSGVFVFTPSLETYRQLVQLGLQEGSFDGGDQGLLNKYYKEWREWDASHRLPFVYNMTAGAIYSYAAALKRHGDDVKIVHFLGRQKPWHSLKTGVHGNDHWTQWHSVFEQNVKQHLPAHLLVRDFPYFEDSHITIATTFERAERMTRPNRSNNPIASYWYEAPLHKHKHHKAQHSHKHQHSSFTHDSHNQPNTPQHSNREPSPDNFEPSPHNFEPSPQNFEPSLQNINFSQVNQTEDHEISSIENAEQEWQDAPTLNLPAHEIDILPSSINEAADLDELLEPVKSAASSIGEDCCCDDYVSDEEGDGKEDQWQQALGDWEAGRPDYAGRDSFDNILSHITKSMGQ